MHSTRQVARWVVRPLTPGAAVINPVPIGGQVTIRTEDPDALFAIPRAQLRSTEIEHVWDEHEGEVISDYWLVKFQLAGEPERSIQCGDHERGKLCASRLYRAITQGRDVVDLAVSHDGLLVHSFAAGREYFP